MALMRISEYQKRFTPESRPARRTVISRIQRKELYGKFEGVWYVDPDVSQEPALHEVADAIFESMTASR